MYYISEEDCTGCAECLQYCPDDAIEEAGEIYRINPYKCTECGNCDEICPFDAIKKG